MKKMIIFAFIAIFSLSAWAQNAKTKSVVIQTNGVSGMCKQKMEQNVPYFKGVTDFSYDEATSKVTVVYNPSKTTPDEIRQAISQLGYDADNVKADPKAREKLPACCKAAKGKAGEHKSCPHSGKKPCGHGSK